MGLGKKATEMKGCFHYIYIKRTYCEHDYDLILTLITWLRWCVSGLSTVNLLFPRAPSPAFCALWKRKSLCPVHTKGWEVMVQGNSYLNVEYQHKLFGILLQWRCVCFLSFIHSIIFIGVNSWIFIVYIES